MSRSTLPRTWLGHPRCHGSPRARPRRGQCERRATSSVRGRHGRGAWRDGAGADALRAATDPCAWAALSSVRGSARQAHARPSPKSVALGCAHGRRRDAPGPQPDARGCGPRGLCGHRGSRRGGRHVRDAVESIGILDGWSRTSPKRPVPRWTPSRRPSTRPSSPRSRTRRARRARRPRVGGGRPRDDRGAHLRGGHP